MSWLDMLLAGAIILGAVYLLYRSIWKKQGYCPGFTAGSCPGKQGKPEGGRPMAGSAV
jgi:hypothetical protein